MVAGGVAANADDPRARWKRCAREHGFAFVAPPLELCTDNAAMIAWAGIERMRAGIDRRRTPCILRRARAGRSTRAAAPLVGSGRRGAKA